jgi:cytochrome c biogenesis protein CcmG/thiol:disulfide interchange protein DsbE
MNDTVDNHQTVQPGAAARPRQLPTWIILLVISVVVGFLMLIGLSLKNTMQGPVTPGDLVPAFSLTSFDGKVYNSSDFKGKVVLINFWASWCKPCEQEAADLEQAWQYYQPGGKVVFLGVDWVDTEPEAKAYLDKFNITYFNGPDLRTAISQIFRIKGVPETYILDQNGRLAKIVDENGNQLNPMIGPYTSVAQIQNAIERLLK